ncbi:hypothetical protein DPMN_097487 [Dreissena polymorpha]|uniref:Uncharacterized protein n=1 Tax=Dreissena polymorpha TaxID=45954 RepID=A0A9D4R4L6_DREPO|nr:hypothetical protein DPMN_097487 [Dreissena polymorpha]
MEFFTRIIFLLKKIHSNNLLFSDGCVSYLFHPINIPAAMVETVAMVAKTEEATATTVTIVLVVGLVAMATSQEAMATATCSLSPVGTATMVHQTTIRVPMMAAVVAPVMGAHIQRRHHHMGLSQGIGRITGITPRSFLFHQTTEGDDKLVGI